MAFQIANPKVLEKLERLARATGLTETALVECAVDRLAEDFDISVDDMSADRDRFVALLVQLDRIPDRADAFDPLGWETPGLLK